MTGLLVSVRNAQEAALAAEAGVDIVDLKEPSRGSLGPVAPSVVEEAAGAVAGRAPLSIACGELRDLVAGPPAAYRLPPPAYCLSAVQYAKIGLAGCAKLADWPHRWRQFQLALPPGTQAVAVAYADAHHCGAPGVQEVVEMAAAAGAGALLVDTCVKNGQRLLDHLSPDRLSRLLATCRAAGMLSVLAGSLDETCLLAVLKLRPDLIAVRGAVCRSGRESALDPQRLASLRAAIYEHCGES